MDIGDIFQSKYLSAADLKGQPRTLTIKAASPEVIGTGEQAGQKLVMQLATPEGQLVQKRLVCNRTNARSISMGYGTKVDSWIGKPIVLRPETTSMQGRLVECIRCYPVPPSSATPSPAPPSPSPGSPGAAAAGGTEDLQSDIPW